MKNETNPTPNRAEKRIELPPIRMTDEDNSATMEWSGVMGDFPRDTVPINWFACRERQLLEALTAFDEAQGEIELNKKVLQNNHESYMQLQKLYADAVRDRTIAESQLASLQGRVAELEEQLEHQCKVALDYEAVTEETEAKLAELQGQGEIERLKAESCARMLALESVEAYLEDRCYEFRSSDLLPPYQKTLSVVQGCKGQLTRYTEQIRAADRYRRASLQGEKEPK